MELLDTPGGGGAQLECETKDRHLDLTFAWTFNFIDQHLTLVFPYDGNVG